MKVTKDSTTGIPDMNLMVVDLCFVGVQERAGSLEQPKGRSERKRWSMGVSERGTGPQECLMNHDSLRLLPFSKRERRCLEIGGLRRRCGYRRRWCGRRDWLSAVVFTAPIYSFFRTGLKVTSYTAVLLL
nr:hypothetical protein CFP56_10138 [Quercus suber]